jgi:hypothetical protein
MEGSGCQQQAGLSSCLQQIAILLAGCFLYSETAFFGEIPPLSYKILCREDMVDIHEIPCNVM